MPDRIGGRYNELLERCIDLEKVDICDEPIHRGIDARWLGPVDKLSCGNEVRQHLQIRESPRVGRGWRVADYIDDNNCC